MGHSRFTSAELRGATIDVTGPFELSAEEAKTTVPLTVHVVLIQGAAYAHGHTDPKGGPAGGDWVVHAEVAGAFTTGKPAQGFGFVSLVDEGPNGDSPMPEMFQWSEPVVVTKGL
ncbi:MAG: hypothetical protein ABW060_12285 [Solirubrobacteraceae bacterium]